MNHIYDAVGLLALAEINTLQQRTALTGTPRLLEALVLCPGMHRQQTVIDLNRGEYPACAAMTTGYVFRVENPATVYYLQHIGMTGQLTTISVTTPETGFEGTGVDIPRGVAVVLAALNLAVCMATRDGVGFLVLLIYVLARLCNILVIRGRSTLGWTGAKEPGVRGDLLILLSQDRWIRIQGLVDDLKAVTSGQWLRDQSLGESWLTATATIMVYLNAGLAFHMHLVTKLMLTVTLLLSGGLVAIANEEARHFLMHGRTLKVVRRRTYGRRLDLAEELIKETGREDWALKMGMVNASRKSSDKQGPAEKEVIM